MSNSGKMLSAKIDPNFMAVKSQSLLRNWLDNTFDIVLQGKRFDLSYGSAGFSAQTIHVYYYYINFCYLHACGLVPLRYIYTYTDL